MSPARARAAEVAAILRSHGEMATVVEGAKGAAVAVAGGILLRVTHEGRSVRPVPRSRHAMREADRQAGEPPCRS